MSEKPSIYATLDELEMWIKRVKDTQVSDMRPFTEEERNNWGKPYENFDIVIGPFCITRLEK